MTLMVGSMAGDRYHTGVVAESLHLIHKLQADYGDWNRFGPHKLMCLNAWPTRDGTIKNGVILLE